MECRHVYRIQAFAFRGLATACKTMTIPDPANAPKHLHKHTLIRASDRGVVPTRHGARMLKGRGCACACLGPLQGYA